MDRRGEQATRSRRDAHYVVTDARADKLGSQDQSEKQTSQLMVNRLPQSYTESLLAAKRNRIK